MPAKLIVVAGEPTGTEFPIADEVLRIGSGTQCELRLPRLAPHAATLEYRDGGYFLHNRGEAPIALGPTELDRRDSAPWPAGADADLGQGLTLRLEVDGDPAPAKAAPGPVTIEYDAEEPAEDEAAAAKKAGGSSKTLQLVVILLAVPLAAWMLLSDPGADSAAKGEPPVSFTKVVETLAESPIDKARGPQSLRAALQHGRAAELRGDRRDARQAYGFVRDTLMTHRQPDGKLRDPEDELVWRYVKRRLQALQGGALLP